MGKRKEWKEEKVSDCFCFLFTGLGGRAMVRTVFCFCFFHRWETEEEGEVWR